MCFFSKVNTCSATVKIAGSTGPYGDKCKLCSTVARRQAMPLNEQILHKCTGVEACQPDDDNTYVENGPHAAPDRSTLASERAHLVTWTARRCDVRTLAEDRDGAIRWCETRRSG